MISEIWLRLTLKSEACFSRGDGTPGVVDVEVNQDRDGFPFLGGRTLKGLLHAEATEIVAALRRASAPNVAHWEAVSERLFGRHGSHHADEGRLHMGDATLPADLRQAVAHMIAEGKVHPSEILGTLTTIRHQTAISAETGAPQEETLRSVRVVLRETEFMAPLRFKVPGTEGTREDEVALLAACVRAFRRAGSNKTRGYGRLCATLHATLDGNDVTNEHFQRFKDRLSPAQEVE